MIRIVALALLCSLLPLGDQAAAQQTASRSQSCRCTTGTATWYGAHAHGRFTASGERFDRHALTAAHRTLPFDTRVRVTNLRNGRSVIVRITDRGPFGRGRVIDLSEAAARELDMVERGIAPVRIERVADPDG
jgi:rare lipoprotein A